MESMITTLDPGMREVISKYMGTKALYVNMNLNDFFFFFALVRTNMPEHNNFSL